MSGYTRDELRAITDWNAMTPPEYAAATAKAALMALLAPKIRLLMGRGDIRDS